MARESRPLNLRIVAYLFMLSGLAGIFKILVSLSGHTLVIAFDVLGIPICFGLLNYSSLWRTLALIFIWVGLIGEPIIFMMGFFAQTTYFELFGIHIAPMPLPLFFIFAAFEYALTVWEYRVLTDGSIRRLFEQQA